MSAWILGGSSGLGFHLTNQARRNGLKTCVLGRGVDWSVDLADRSSVERLCRRITKADPRIIREIKFFFWNAGVLDYRPFDEVLDLERSLNINILHPTLILRALIARKINLDSAIHLVTISSVASWRARNKMAIYAGAKAYQAQFSRALSLDLEKSHLGSKVTVVMPIGIKTNIFKETGIDSSKFMEPRLVARLIWGEVLHQEKSCDWFSIFSERGKPVVSRRVFAPELASDELPLYNRSRS